jgi:large conductance mechanosensitive channel
MSQLLQDFRAFALRGSLVELAVAFVLGLAFAAVVTSFVDDIVMQIIAAVFGKPDFSDLTFNLGDAVIRYGAFLTALVTFIIIAFVLFLIVRAVERAMPSKPTELQDCPHCLASIPAGARVCQFCTREVGGLAAPGV